MTDLLIHSGSVVTPERVFVADVATDFAFWGGLTPVNLRTMEDAFSIRGGISGCQHGLALVLAELFSTDGVRGLQHFTTMTDAKVICLPAKSIFPAQIQTDRCHFCGCVRCRGTGNETPGTGAFRRPTGRAAHVESVR
jgi:hypothetical protein